MSPYFQDEALTFYCGHVLEVLRALPDQIDLFSDYLDLAIRRCAQTTLWFGNGKDTA